MIKLYNLVRLLCLTTTLVVLGSSTSKTFAQNYSIQSVKIYDQTTDSEVPNIGALSEGSVVDAALLPENFYLVAGVSSNIYSVDISVNGETQNREGISPFTWPNGAEDSNNWNAANGSYSVAVEGHTSYGSTTAKATLEFTFSIQENCGTVSGFILMNTDTNDIITELHDGDVIGTTELPARYHIQTLTSGTVGSVVTEVNGTVTGNDNIAPFKFPHTGDAWNGGVGSYTINSSAYTQDDASGISCDAASISFSIEDNCGSITGFQLVNSDTEEVIAQLNDNDRLDASTLPTNYHIEILTEGNVESVSTDVNGDERTENLYTWDYPDSGNSWNAGVGAYVISSVAYSQDDALGTACDQLAICLFIDAPICEYETSADDCVYTTSDTEQCNAGGFYQLWVSGEGQAETIGTTSFVENTELGTANYQGVFKLGQDTITVNAVYSGLTTNAPTGSPKDHFCENVDATDWKYYTEVCGTFDSQLYGPFYITRMGPAFQLGEGANITSQSGTQLGGSGWFYLTSPTDCPAYTHGDFNFNLAGGCESTEICETLEFLNFPTQDIIMDYDATLGGAVLEWEDPIGSTVNGNIDVVQIEGPASGSLFETGTTTKITYAASNGYNCENVASFNVIVRAPEPCDALSVVSQGFSVVITHPDYKNTDAILEFFDSDGNLLYTEPAAFNSRGQFYANPSLGYGYHIVNIQGQSLVCSKQFFYSPEE